MFRVLHTELLKLKRTRILWLVLAGALPSFLLCSMTFLPKITVQGTADTFNMQELFYRQGQILTMLGPALFALITGYIFAREYQERTINQLFSYPASRIKFLVAKLAAVFLLIAVTTALSFVSGICSVLIFKHYLVMPVVLTALKMNAMVCILSFGTVPVAAALSMVGKSLIPTTVMGVFVTVIVVIGVASHSAAGIIFPWLTPYWPVRLLAQGIAQNSGPNPFAMPAVASLAITFLVSLIFCIRYYLKSDIHSGS